MRRGVIRGEHVCIRLHEVHNVERKSPGEDGRQIDAFPRKRECQSHLHLRPRVTDGPFAFLRHSPLAVIVEDQVAYTRVLFLPVDTHLLAVRVQRLTIRRIPVRVIGVLGTPVGERLLVIRIYLGLVLEDT